MPAQGTCEYMLQVCMQSESATGLHMYMSITCDACMCFSSMCEPVSHGEFYKMHVHVSRCLLMNLHAGVQYP